ncbi:hypothetical protein Micr_00021 [Candidatus Micrarchaeum sp.]|jgi:transcriptional antiterminator|uniref:hypothetical protein n=1 Tax=Candidatus Micrarchaeum sp. TaxID=2282148 RepID=UPI0009284570|nr:hypothetical protein [Candidatus Micrarchaeum sp.]OJI07061.1 MAG: hypothetical protein BK997_04375 [Candidatus Micrarchaeum sp. ARMAN-1]OJT94472.1 MAG: hypothetical protein JJ59_03465 [Candidatus Micrarchaeum sp. AZ1]OWP53830.1 MAG: hypothetical protein B2I19_01525 [Thermoplasmatales archaeon ARMAN]QRF73511.1 hypothetical protein Micr_00021 [Candidatus Micrarchaeum sp.]
MTAEHGPGASDIDESRIPSWIACEDLLVKMREELIDRAIKLLNREIESGHIAVNGSTLFSSEANADVEEAMYLINNLIDDSGRLHKEYSEYIEKNNGKKLSDAEAKKFGELQKFVLSVEQLNMLMEYARVLSSWADAAGKMIEGKDTEDILRKTIDKEELRKTVLEFFINDSECRVLLSSKEIEAIKSVLGA